MKTKHLLNRNPKKKKKRKKKEFHYKSNPSEYLTKTENLGPIEYIIQPISKGRLHDDIIKSTH